jgi:aryl-alcohol dehydrogenase-like predicted oxidoreductase
MTPHRDPNSQAGALKKRRLGRTGLLVTELGMGGAHLSAEGKGEDTVLEALSLGINFIETGRLYKGSEYLIGGALMQFDGRAGIHVASKTLARSRDGALADLERSLQHLRLETIDLYQLNDIKPDIWDEIMAEDSALAGLKEARAQGLVRFIGITSHNRSVLRRAIETGEFDTIQVKWGAFHADNAGVMRLACERDIGVIGMKPYGGFGMFGSLKGSEFERHLSPAALLRFALSHESLSTCIPGVRSPGEVRENVRVARAAAAIPDRQKVEVIEQAKSFLRLMRSPS